MRPIVAGPSSPTRRLDNFIDLILKPLSKHVPSFAGDDIDFLQQIPEEIDKNSLFISFDVVSLHTSFPHELGLTAVKYWLNNYKGSIARPFSKEFILAAISIVLKENTFHFDGKFYRQIQGTAMGTKAPFTLYLIAFRAGTKTYPVWSEQTRHETAQTVHTRIDIVRKCDLLFLLYSGQL